MISVTVAYFAGMSWFDIVKQAVGSVESQLDSILDQNSAAIPANLAGSTGPVREERPQLFAKLKLRESQRDLLKDVIIADTAAEEQIKVDLRSSSSVLQDDSNTQPMSSDVTLSSQPITSDVIKKDLDDNPIAEAVAQDSPGLLDAVATGLVKETLQDSVQMTKDEDLISQIKSLTDQLCREREQRALESQELESRKKDRAGDGTNDLKTLIGERDAAIKEHDAALRKLGDKEVSIFGLLQEGFMLS